MTMNTTLKDRLSLAALEVDKVSIDRDASVNGLPATAVTVLRRKSGVLVEETVTVAKQNKVGDEHLADIVISYLK